VVGGGNTVWKGTAFQDCRTSSSNEIVLRHSQFESGMQVGECDNGMIMGRSINRTFSGPTDSKFTSQLVIHLPLLNATNSSLDGRTVECIYDNGHNVINIGTHVIAYTREGTCVNVIVSSWDLPNFSMKLKIWDEPEDEATLYNILNNSNLH
jgi:hypothetical protein